MQVERTHSAKNFDR